MAVAHSMTLGHLAKLVAKQSGVKETLLTCFPLSLKRANNKYKVPNHCFTKFSSLDGCYFFEQNGEKGFIEFIRRKSRHLCQEMDPKK